VKKHRRLAETNINHCECCTVTKLEDGRCHVILPPRGETAAIGGTPYQKNHGYQARLADGIVFWSPADDNIDVAAAVELKSGRVPVSEATRQLQNGADLVDDLSRDVPHVIFMPILTTRRLDTVEHMMIERARVTFRGRRHQIVRVRCGADLSTVMRPRGRTKR
jgi:hypothetical protein